MMCRVQVTFVMAVTAAAPQPDSLPVIPFKSLPHDLITQDPYAPLHSFVQDQHDAIHNQILPGSFASQAKDTFHSKFPSISLPSASHPPPHASSSLFIKPGWVLRHCSSSYLNSQSFIIALTISNVLVRLIC